MLHQCLVALILTIELTVDEELAHCFLKYMYVHMKAFINGWFHYWLRTFVKEQLLHFRKFCFMCLDM